MRYLIPLYVIILLLLRFVAEIGDDRSPGDRFRVLKIIDGDTVELAGGDRLRLIGIDCPEQGEPFYDSACIFLSKAALGKIVDAAFAGRRRDGYGRLLAYMYIDSLFINRDIIRNGYGYVYLFEDNLSDRERIGQLLTAQEEAITDGRGIWSVSHHPEPFYLVKKGSFRFHRPGCKAVRDLLPTEYIRFDSRLEAFRTGYSPCRNCRP
jgi:micrococcal nuclease